MPIFYTDSSISPAQSAANTGLSPTSPKRLPSEHTIASGDEVWLKGGGPPYDMPNVYIPCQWSTILNGTLRDWPGFPKPVVRHTSVPDTVTQARVFALGSGGNWTVKNIIFRDCVGACYNMNTGGGTGIMRSENNEFYNCGTLLYPGPQYLTVVSAGGTSALAEFYMFGCVFDGAGSDQVWARAANKIEVAYNVFRNPSLFDTNGDNFQVLDACADLWVHHNVFDHTNMDSKQCFIQSGTATGLTRFEDNIVLGWMGPTSSLHTAVYSDQRMICRRNVIAATASAVYYGTNGTRVYGNLIIGGGGRANAGLVWGAALTDLQVYNNVILKLIPGTDVGEAAIRSTTSNSGIIARNNVIRGFRRGIRRGADSIERLNSISGAEIPVIDAGNVSSLAQNEPLVVDSAPFETWFNALLASRPQSRPVF